MKRKQRSGGGPKSTQPPVVDPRIDFPNITEAEIRAWLAVLKWIGTFVLGILTGMASNAAYDYWKHKDAATLPQIIERVGSVENNGGGVPPCSGGGLIELKNLDDGPRGKEPKNNGIYAAMGD